MGKTKGPYTAEFAVGSAVHIKDRSFLEDFQRRWKFHHPLRDEQVAFAGRTAVVTHASVYHGGDELYQMEGIPGVWNEECLEEAEERQTRQGRSAPRQRTDVQQE
jgi:hypothetical protein